VGGTAGKTAVAPIDFLRSVLCGGALMPANGVWWARERRPPFAVATEQNNQHGVNETTAENPKRSPASKAGVHAPTTPRPHKSRA